MVISWCHTLFLHSMYYHISHIIQASITSMIQKQKVQIEMNKMFNLITKKFKMKDDIIQFGKRYFHYSEVPYHQSGSTLNLFLKLVFSLSTLFFQPSSIFNPIEVYVYSLYIQRINLLRVNINFSCEVLQHFKYFKPPNRSFLYRIGDPADEIFFLYSGQVSYLDKFGNIYMSIEKGHIFGEMEVLDFKTREVNAVVYDNAEILVLQKETFLKIIDQYKDIIFEIDDMHKKRKQFFEIKKSQVAQNHHTIKKMIFRTPVIDSAKQVMQQQLKHVKLQRKGKRRIRKEITISPKHIMKSTKLGRSRSQKNKIFPQPSFTIKNLDSIDLDKPEKNSQKTIQKITSLAYRQKIKKEENMLSYLNSVSNPNQLQKLDEDCELEFLRPKSKLGDLLRSSIKMKKSTIIQEESSDLSLQFEAKQIERVITKPPSQIRKKNQSIQIRGPQLVMNRQRNSMSPLKKRKNMRQYKFDFVMEQLDKVFYGKHLLYYNSMKMEENRFNLESDIYEVSSLIGSL